MTSVIDDLRYGLRNLFANPGFTLVAVLSLAIGIGAVSSVYSMISSTLIHPTPYEDADRLVALTDFHIPSGDTHSMSYPGFLDYQDQLEKSFQDVAAYSSGSYNLTGPEGPERVTAGLITHGFFTTLREDLAAGRSFYPEEDEIGTANIAIISHRLWKGRFNGRDMIGEAITLDNNGYTVVGIANPDFKFLNFGYADVFVPAAGREWAENRGSGWLRMVGRLNDGVTFEQAADEMNAIMDGLREVYPRHYTEHEIRVARFGEDNIEDFKVAFLILMGAVGFVLLIACVNVANLLLARVAGRTKEITIRTAVGAARGRIVRQLLTESVVLASIGGGLGIVFAYWGINFIHALLPAEMGSFYVEYFEFHMNTEVLAVTMAIAMTTGLIFGILPSLQASKPDLTQALKEGGAAGSGTRRNRLLSGLVVAEVALAIVLLVSAGLMMQSFANIQRVDPGFNTSNLLTASLNLPEGHYAEGEQVSAFIERLEDRVSGLGGVESVGLSGLLPFTDSNSTNSIAIEGKPEPEPGHYDYGSIRAITPNYFPTMEIPILKGRNFTRSDYNKDAPVTIVNETLAKKYWPNDEVIGKRFKLGGYNSETPWISIVGVVKDIRYSGMTSDFIPEFFLPHKENTWRGMHIVLRTQGNAEALAPALRATVLELDPNLPLNNIETMESLISESIWMNEFLTTLFGMLAVIALVLAVIGIYGVINYQVSQRTHEIGIRMALGAQMEDVRRLVVRQGLKLVGLGIVIGIPAALGLMRFMSMLFYGISPNDPVTFAVITVAAIIVGLAASYIPARRATKVDPMIALRYE